MKVIQANDRAAVTAFLAGRTTQSFPVEETKVTEIIRAVQAKGDEALFSYTKTFDAWEPTSDTVRVSEEEMETARREVDAKLLETIRRAAENIRDFHARQIQESWFVTRDDGTFLGQKVTPLDSVGVYVPGGKAAYPSTVLMDVIPAKVADVERVILTTPADANGRVRPEVLAAAKEAGADAVYRVGGAQAVAALAYGTESIPKVDKIVGPGNIYVALAKRQVFGVVGIDQVAGPSEILVLADETADPRAVAADLLSQAEHDELASAVLVTTSETLAEAVQPEIDRFLAKLTRRTIIEASLSSFGRIFLAKDLPAAVELVNAIAPEHLEIMTRDPFETMAGIRHAGAIFLGPYSSEPLGDYYAGPNHTLPTNGTARFFSPLSVDDFVKKSSVIHYSKEALANAEADIRRFAKSEGLTAHANSIAVRFEKEDQADQ